MKQIDKAGKSYWNTNWSQVALPKPFDSTDTSLDNYVNLELHKYFLEKINFKKEFSVLEIGCANSIWPVYFHKYFNATVYGLDYSEIGCEKSRAIFKYYNIPGDVYCADLFDPPSDLLEKFDLVVSFGVIEHFDNTSNCLKACASFVRPGGYLFTLIPNIPSIIGFIQKYIDRDVYNVHLPITRKMLIEAHNKANLSLNSCDYFMSINLNVINSGTFSNHPLNKYLRHAFSILSKTCWIAERYGLKIPINRVTSPYLIAIASL